MAGMIPPSRTAVPLSGSFTPSESRLDTYTGADQVAPRSSERITATRADCAPPSGVSIRLNTFSSAPLGSTTIWLPMVWLRMPGSKIGRAVSQLAPPLVLRVK